MIISYFRKDDSILIEKVEILDQAGHDAKAVPKDHGLQWMVPVGVEEYFNLADFLWLFPRESEGWVRVLRIGDPRVGECGWTQRVLENVLRRKIDKWVIQLKGEIFAEFQPFFTEPQLEGFAPGFLCRKVVPMAITRSLRAVVVEAENPGSLLIA
mgnify:CR=1 FL=1